jgi:hypothetical protein
MNNWKTTATGVIAIVSALLSAASGLLSGHAVDWTSVIAAVSAGIGLIHAQDSKPQ